MSFRCLFIIRTFDVDNNDLQPYCYKPFNNITEMKYGDNSSFTPLNYFNEWYLNVLTTISDATYTNFDELSIKDYLSSPIYKIKTDFGNLEPCILINKNNFVFGGLLCHTSNEKTKINIKYDYGASVDFICGMASYFLNLIKRNPKIKIVDLIPDFYHFIKIMCPYGTPITSNYNFVEFFKNPENILKSLNISYPEKTVVSLNQLSVNPTMKNKELKITIKEVVTGVQHENKIGQVRHDIDIIGEVVITALNLDWNCEISFSLKPNQKFLSAFVLTDLLLHPSCISCSYQTPITISMLNRKPTGDLTDKTLDDSPNSPNFLVNDNSLVQSVSKRYSNIDSITLNRRLQTLSRASSITSNNEINKLSSTINVKVKPWSDSYTLLSYKMMQYSNETDTENISIPFIISCKSPESPIICSYQLEDMSTSPEITSNIMFRIQLNPNFFPIGEKSKPIEFSKFDIVFPFPNRPPLYDANKCSVSQGKMIILEQNRHVMVWSPGSILKKNEACLIGSIKFHTSVSQTPLVDKFCVQSNAYVQVQFALKSNNLSGLAVDTRNISFSIDNGVKITQRYECASHNFKVWNSIGDCPIELYN